MMSEFNENLVANSVLALSKSVFSGSAGVQMAVNACDVFWMNERDGRSGRGLDTLARLFGEEAKEGIVFSICPNGDLKVSDDIPDGVIQLVPANDSFKYRFRFNVSDVLSFNFPNFDADFIRNPKSVIKGWVRTDGKDSAIFDGEDFFDSGVADS